MKRDQYLIANGEITLGNYLVNIGFAIVANYIPMYCRENRLASVLTDSLLQS